MLETEKYKLSTYRSIETLRKTEDAVVEIVESSLDGKRYIKKIYHSDKRAAYNSLKQIKNPYIPQIYEVFFGEDTIVIEEYVTGETLGSLIDRKCDFPRDAVKQIINCLINAVLELHHNNIIHRDIKPGNIIIRPNGEAVLIDYSIARTYSSARSDDTEHFGTIGYAAPEQYGFAQSDFRTDIYALGITLQAITSEKNATKQMLRAIGRCVEFDPNRRFQSVQELRSFLEQSEKKAHRRKRWILFTGLFLAAAGITIRFMPQNDSTKLEKEMTPERIIDVSGVDEGCAYLSIEQDKQNTAKVQIAANIPAVLIEAVQKDDTLAVVIDGTTEYLFTDDSGISTESYPDGKMFTEIVLYDMDQDGAMEIIPVMTNGHKHEWPNGEIAFLKNYSMAWCIYYENGLFHCAENKMTAVLEDFKIYDAMPGCIQTDFPMYYTLEEGEIILNE